MNTAAFLLEYIEAFLIKEAAKENRDDLGGLCTKWSRKLCKQLTKRNLINNGEIYHYYKIKNCNMFPMNNYPPLPHSFVIVLSQDKKDLVAIICPTFSQFLFIRETETLARNIIDTIDYVIPFYDKGNNEHRAIILNSVTDINAMKHFYTDTWNGKINFCINKIDMYDINENETNEIDINNYEIDINNYETGFYEFL